MKKLRLAFASSLAATCITCAWAQTTSTPVAQQPTNPSQGSNQPAPAGQTTTTPPTAPAASPTWSIGGVDFSGTIDGYYSFNNNHPPESLTDGNQLYNFDTKANSFDLNMAKLTVSHDPDPFGFRFDFGFGRAFDIMHASEQTTAFKYIEQAYVDWKPKSGKGFELDFGDFVTSAGAEVIETKDNWNYSRSILFSYAIPYYHFGLRTSKPFGDWNLGLQVVNGWNDVTDNNSGKTIGVTGGVTKKKYTWSNNYYVGPEKPYLAPASGTPETTFNSLSQKGNRNLYDTTLLLTPKDAFNAYINFDYGEDHILESGLAPYTLGPGHARWVGIAGAAHFQVSKHVAFTPRGEWFNDADGFTTGMRQRIKEVTMTGEYKWDQGVLTRLEYRYDDSNAPFFYRGSVPNAGKSQTTITLGVVAFFGPKT